MMLLSVASGNAITGGLILGSFVLGTSPTFFVLGIASGEIMKRNSLKYFAALAIFILAIISINTGQILRGSVHTLQNYWAVATSDTETSGNVQSATANLDSDGKQEVKINVYSSGYSSDVKTIKSGVPVKLTLITNNVQGCSRAFTIPEYGISKILPANGVETLEFTPISKGRLTYTCSMGMYTGYFNVI
jgi:hypothetical protein